MKFKEWFNKKLVVGSMPNYKEPKKCSCIKKAEIIINVSDEYSFDAMQLLPLNKKEFWFPMNERKRDIGLNSIYGAMVVLHNAERYNMNVYLHCHAGANRSPTVEACYYFMRTGKDLEELGGGFINRMYANCSRGYLPPITELKAFLTLLGKYLEENRTPELSVIKIKTINNF